MRTDMSIDLFSSIGDDARLSVANAAKDSFVITVRVRGQHMTIKVKRSDLRLALSCLDASGDSKSTPVGIVDV